MKKVIGLVFVLCMVLGCMPAFAQMAEVYENFTIEETEDTVIIKGCKDTAVTQLNVPGEISGKKAVLAPEAFCGYESLESITFGEGIEIIPENLCYNCKKLKNVEFSSTVKTVGESAFSSCNSLVEIDIKNTEELQAYAFTSDNLTKVTHNGKLRRIDDWCFAFTDLKEFDFTGVEFLGNRSFGGTKLEKIYLPDLKDWDGIATKDVNEETMEHKDVQIAYYPLKASELELQKIGTPFMWCSELKEVKIRYPETGVESYKSLFIECENIERVIFENFPGEPSSWEFYNTEVMTENYPLPEGIENMHKTGWIQTQKKALKMVEPELKFTVYGEGDGVRVYAEKLGVPFEGMVEPALSETRVEETVTVELSENTVLREELFDKIEEIAEKSGGTVYRNNVSIGVKKANQYFVIMNDSVTYIDNGLIVNESLYVDGKYVKMPAKAIYNVLGYEMSVTMNVHKRSEAYKKALETYENHPIITITDKIETYWGTIFEWCTRGVMHGAVNELVFIRWDGESVSITKDAPYANVWYVMECESIEISDDGRFVAVTYPKIMERAVYSPGAENRVLREAGTYVITVDMENCESVCEIIPLNSQQTITD